VHGSSWGVVESLNSMLNKEIWSSFGNQFVSKSYRSIWKRDSKPVLHQTVFLTFEVLTLSSSNKLWIWKCVSLSWTLCGSLGTCGLGIPSESVHWAWCVAIAVSLGIVNHHMPSRLHCHLLWNTCISWQKPSHIFRQEGSSGWSGLFGHPKNTPVCE
jgi:hypothetical protein